MRQLSPDDLNSEFEKNYEYYRQWIERGLVKQVYDRRRFDDLCQDTFVKALTYLARQDAAKLPQTDYHLGNLLCMMAIQVAIDDSRKNKKSRDYLLLSEIEDTQLPELMVEGDENRICELDRFQKAFVQLSPEQQDIVRWMLQGFKQKDIAVELHVSEPTVSEYLKRIRAEFSKTIYPVTADIKRVYKGVDIERLLKNIHRYKHERLISSTIEKQLDDLSEIRQPPGWQYTRRQVRYIDEEQFVMEAFGPDHDIHHIIDFVYPDDYDDVILVARPNELLISREVKKFREIHSPTQPWGKTNSTKQITARPTIEVN